MYIECLNNHLKHISKVKDWTKWFLRFLPHWTLLSNSLNEKLSTCICCKWFGLHSDTYLTFLTSPLFFGDADTTSWEATVPQLPPVITSWTQCNHGSRAMREAAVPLPFICTPHVCKKNLLSTLYLELVLSVSFGNKRTFTAKLRMVLNFMAFLICIQICVSWISLGSCWQHMAFWFWDRLIRRCIVIKLLTTHFTELNVNKSKSDELNLLKNTRELKN